MQKILITGGAGFIGSSLAEALLTDTENAVVLVDNLLTGSEKNISLHENCTFIKADVNIADDIKPIMEQYRFDHVFHYAAVVGVNRTIQYPGLVLEDIYGLQNIFSLAKDTGVKRIFFSSSSEVYGEPLQLPAHEHHTPLNAKMPYAVIKNLGECFCRTYQQEFGLDYTILRFFNTYGPKQSADFVISKFLALALSNAAIPIYGDGSQTRTFCYIQDNIDFTLEIFNKQLHLNDVINVGSDSVITIKALAELIINLTGSASKIIYLPPLKNGDMARRQPDIGKMQAVLKKNLIELNEGLSYILQEIKRDKK